MTDKTLLEKLERVRLLTAELNQAIREAATGLDSVDIKIEVQITDCSSIGRQFPYPILDVKVSQIKYL